VIIRKHKRTAAEQEAAVVQALKKIRPDFQFRHTGNCKHIDKWRKAAVAIDIE
jgi:uncharacterized protein YprB with RNaseH-like and TPR domain